MRWRRSRKTPPAPSLRPASIPRVAQLDTATVELHVLNGRVLFTAPWPPAWGWRIDAEWAARLAGAELRKAIERQLAEAKHPIDRRGPRQAFLRDVANVESIADYNPTSRVIFQHFGPAALAALRSVTTEMDDLSRRFPNGCIRGCADGWAGRHFSTSIAFDADDESLGSWVIALLDGAPESPRPTQRSRSEASEVAFGYKTGWLAVRADAHEQVVTALGLRRTEEVDWADGLTRAYATGVLVTPPVNGWVLVVGTDVLVRPPDIAALSRVLDTEVQRFAAHRVSDAYEWGRANSGAMGRQVLTTVQGTWRAEGEPTEVERRLGLDLAETSDDGLWPDEEMVLEVAGAWSIDPQLLDESMVDGRSVIWGIRP